MKPFAHAVHGLAVAVLLLATLAGCATAPTRNPIAEWRGSPNYGPRRARIIVLHHTSMDSAEAALRVLQTGNADGPVSAHYLIGADGHLYQLVAEDARAWHAGESRWAGMDDLNSASIGIEIDNDGQSPYPEAQIQTLLRLLADVIGRLHIPRHLVVAHGDVAPTVKNDPGVLFPWRRLAEAGFGLWPRAVLASPPTGFDPWLALRLVGYDLRDPAAAVRAFHRHFRAGDSETWQPGDAEILYDLQQQLVCFVADAAFARKSISCRLGIRGEHRCAS
ncbi:MAG TPA: N-acetylmuramoyl-L-alanine amidase [Luteimonas sp.]|nr:N-acetylmuramoyl-L-alanine amidase [Luteimonas sp.]